jgi:septum formation protein
MAHLILASSSPRRKELLEQLGLEFDIFSPDIDESVYKSEQAHQYVQRLAEQKAHAVLTKFKDSIVIAADTSLSLDGIIIGKPESKQHAFEIWQSLSGRTHEVLSGVCVASQKKSLSTVVKTQVEFQKLSQQDMEQYWMTGEPEGKAGAYAIQGIAAKFIPRIVGSYTNVVGLPLHETANILNLILKNG